MWAEFLRNHDLPLLYKLVSFVLSIPVSNAYSERVFSLMKHAWSDQRNLMSTSLLKAELQIRSNYNLNCVEFFEFLGKSENLRLLMDAKSSEKYVMGN